MSMVYDPVTKEFRLRPTPSPEQKTQAEAQQAAALDYQRHQAHRRHQVQRRRLQQDIIFWSVLLGVAILLAFVIYEVNTRLKSKISTVPNFVRPDVFQRPAETPPPRPPR
ncbi:MAG: hypothetical protein NTV49_01815 [Kiritimatiellaeota bacterium]|nr:hypothetical protein [Kiritimatiellota bacterium]